MGAPENSATQAQIAEFLQISVRTLRRWENEGDGPPRLLTRGRVIRYDWAEVRAWAKGPAGQAHGVAPQP